MKINNNVVINKRTINQFQEEKIKEFELTIENEKNINYINEKANEHFIYLKNAFLLTIEDSDKQLNNNYYFNKKNGKNCDKIMKSYMNIITMLKTKIYTLNLITMLKTKFYTLNLITMLKNKILHFS